MNRSLTALLAALEALLVVGVGVGIALVPLTVLWGAQYGFAADWVVFWRASADTWLLGHGVDLQVALDAALAASVGMPQGSAAFPLTIAPLGFALLTVLLAVRAGRRVGETAHRGLGTVVSLATFGLLATLVSLSAVYPLARPSITQGVLLPTLVYAAGFALGMLRTRKHEADHTGSSLRDWVADWPTSVRALVRTGLQGGAAVVAAVLAVSAGLTAVLLVLNYARVIALYEGLHAGAIGGFALTVAQIAFMPNLVIWVASWLVGPGFAIGAGSSVSPVGTQLGPLPSVPLLGALPESDTGWGFLGLIVPIALAFLVAAMLRARLLRELDVDRPLAWFAATALAMGIAAALLLGFLAAAAGGAAGPGRLAEVGPDALVVALWTLLEVTVAGFLGFLASKPRRLER